MADLNTELREIAEALRRLILNADSGLIEAIKWGTPAHENNRRICYLATTKVYVTLGFFDGTGLTDTEGLMESIQPEQYTSWIREAVALYQRR